MNKFEKYDFVLSALSFLFRMLQCWQHLELLPLSNGIATTSFSVLWATLVRQQWKYFTFLLAPRGLRGGGGGRWRQQQQQQQQQQHSDMISAEATTVILPATATLHPLTESPYKDQLTEHWYLCLYPLPVTTYRWEGWPLEGLLKVTNFSIALMLYLLSVS